MNNLNEQNRCEQHLHPLLRTPHPNLTTVVMAIACLVVWGLAFPLALFAQEASSIIPPAPSISDFSKPAVMLPPPGEQPNQERALLPPPPPLMDKAVTDANEFPKDGPGFVKENPDFKTALPPLRPPLSKSLPTRGLSPQASDGESAGLTSDSSQSREPGDSSDSADQSEKQQAAQDARMLKQMQSSVRGMEQGIKMYQRQVDALTKKGLAVPADVSETLAKVKTSIAAVKSAASLEEAQEAISDVHDGMQTLQESRETLDKLARLPQVFKQIDGTLKNLGSQLKKSQSIAARLAKQGFDISDLTAKFQSGIAELQGVRDQAKTLSATDVDGTFDLLENDFFDKMDDVMESNRTIQSLSNLGRFTSEYKRTLADTARALKDLKRQKIDTAPLEEKIAAVKEAGAAVVALLKAKPIDSDSVQEAVEAFGSARQDFDSTREDLAGDNGAAMPWEQGPSQFTAKGFDAGSLSKFLPSKE